MKIKKDHLLIIVLVVLIILGLGIWFFLNNSQPSINKTIDDQLSSCEEASSGYVGLSEAEAITKAESHATAEANQENRSHRVISRDGVGQTLSADLVESRLNFAINKGIVEKVTCG